MGGGGAPPQAPAQQTVSQTSEFPEELKPYISDILERAKARAEAKDEADYQVFPGPRLAGFTPEQIAAQTGITGLVQQGISSDPMLASAKTYMAPAFGSTLAATQQFTPAAAQQYMSPYMQSVVDIQKREAQREGKQAMQKLAGQAAMTQPFGGSRQAILEAEQMRNQAQLLSDIQQKGSQVAFEQAAAQFEREKARQLTGGQQLAALGELAPRLATAELGALAGVGAQKQEQAQRATDIGYQQFLEEQQYPERVLQEYSSIIRGFPLTPNVFSVTQTAVPPPNLATQAIGLLGAGASGYKAFASTGGGLSSLPLKKTKVVKKQYGGGLLGLSEIEEPAMSEYIPESTSDIKEPVYGYSPESTPFETSMYNKYGLRGTDYSKLNELLQARLANLPERLKEREKESEEDKYLAAMQGFIEMATAGGEGKGIVEGLTRGAKVATPLLQKAIKSQREGKRLSQAEELELAKAQAELGSARFAENIKILEITQDIELKNRELLRKIAKDKQIDGNKFQTTLNNTVNILFGTELEVLDPRTKVAVTLANQRALENIDRGASLNEALIQFQKDLRGIAGGIPSNRPSEQNKPARQTLENVTGK
jgi:hypothetical protein